MPQAMHTMPDGSQMPDELMAGMPGGAPEQGGDPTMAPGQYGEQPQAPEQQPQATFQDRVVDGHPELINLAELMEEAELARISELVYYDYEEDEESRQDWLAMHAEWTKLAFGKLKPINPPWPGSSDESLPMVLEGCNQFHARAYKAFFSKPDFVAALPMGNITQPDRDRAERIGQYMSWQLDVQDRAYKRNKDRLLRSLPLHGSFFTKTYRDQVKRKNVVENVRAVDLVVPYQCVGLDIEDLERKTHVMWKSIRECKYLVSQGFFRSLPDEYTQVDNNEMQDVVDQATGMTAPGMQRVRPAKILEQHRYLDLDGDGVEEPYIVWCDAQSKKVLRISVRWATDAMGNPTNFKQPIEYFTHYVYLENPDGFYGLGVGHMTGDINKAVNRMLRQLTDAGTLQNLRPGFASKNVGMQKGQIEFELGKIKTVDGAIDDIRKGIMFMEHPGPSSALMQTMQYLVERGDRLNMVTDMMTGQPDKVYQPTTALAMIEQASMIFSAVQLRVHAALEQELNKLYRLNGLYLDERQYFTFHAPEGPQQAEIFRLDFQDDMQVRPSFDPNHSTEEAKLKRAQLEYDAALKNPLIANSPPHLANATRRFFEAVGTTQIDDICPTIETVMQQQQQAQQQAAAQAEQQGGVQQAQATLQGAAKEAELELRMRELDIKEKDVGVKAAKAAADIRNAKDGVTLDKIHTVAALEQQMREALNAGEETANVVPTSPPPPPGPQYAPPGFDPMAPGANVQV